MILRAKTPSAHKQHLAFDLQWNHNSLFLVLSVSDIAHKTIGQYMPYDII